MPFTSRFLLVLGLGLAAQPANADDALSCVNKDERRALIASGQVIPLKSALAGLAGRSGEVVKARICRSPKGYVYLLTLLARDGKVARLTVDAKSGTVVADR